MFLMKRGLYIHIPFCVKKCGYCDFLSFPEKEVPPLYTKTLLREMEGRKGGGRVDTIYLGGGTPSLLSPHQVEGIMATALKTFGFTGGEVTMEINPATVNLERLRAFKGAGINRVIVGIQSFNRRLLSILGRVHTPEEGVEAFRLARKAGFENIGIDLIHSIPTEDMEELREDLGRAVSLGPEHISVYSLTLEEGTPLKRAVETGKLPSPSEDMERDMFYLTRDLLTGAGYDHYEVSNFAIPGFRSRHNQIYWKGEEYIGLGLGAHSYEKKGWGRRMMNSERPQEYICLVERKGEAIVEDEELSKEKAMEETILLRLRMKEGIDLKEFRRRFGIDLRETRQQALRDLEGLGMVSVEGNAIKVTEKGLVLLDEIVVKLI